MASGGQCVKPDRAKGYVCRPLPPGQPPTDEALKECREQCELGNAESCYNASVAIFPRTAQDQAEKFMLLGKACEGNVGKACRGSEERLLKACNLLDPEGCGRLGEWYQTAKADDPRAERYLTLGCNMGNHRSCDRLGIFYMQNKQPAAATRVLESACDRGAAGACLTMRLNYLHSPGGTHAPLRLQFPKDPAKAEELLKKQCLWAPGYSICREKGLR